MVAFLWMMVFHAVLLSAEQPPVYAASQILGDIRPEAGEVPKNWGARIAQQYFTYEIEPADDVLELKFPFSDWRYYSELQNELAKRFPEEATRPTIKLSLRNSVLPPEKIIGVVGGLGPLADASLVAQVESEFNSDESQIHSVELRVNSDPHPPRSFWAGLNASTWSYIWDIAHFMRESDVHEFVLGSNTAHIHLGLFNKLS